MQESSSFVGCLLDPPRFGFNGNWVELAAATACVVIGVAGLARLEAVSRSAAIKRPMHPGRVRAVYYQFMTVMGGTEDAMGAVRSRFGGAHFGLVLLGLLLLKAALFSRC